jgi:hypothetical protein
MIIRPDFIFSYWIFIWFILYFTRIITINPKLWLILGLTIEIIVVCFMLLHFDFYYIFRFIFINFWIKVLPIYFIWNTKIRTIDVVYSFILFVIYLAWLYLNNQTIYTIYKMIYNSHTKNAKYISIGAYLYDKIKSLIS